MKLSKKFRVKIKSRVLMILLIVTVLSSILAVDKIANGQESMIGQMEFYMDGEEATEIASVYDSSLTSEDRLQNTDTITYIYDANDLVAFRDDVNAGNDYAGKTVYVMANIDMSSVCSESLGSFTPIGATGTNFAGTFNGNYHTISNLYMKEINYPIIGLFKQTTTTSVIRNLMMENLDMYNEHNVIGDYTVAGGIVGANYGDIVNCGINSGSVIGIKTTAYTGSNYVGCFAGGIAGLGGKNIDSCYNKANIMARTSTKNYPNEAFAGGIIGNFNADGKILNCYNTGNTDAEGYQGFAGGITGSATKVSNEKSIKNCYSTGIPKATGNYAAYAGGIIGRTGWSASNLPIDMDNIYHTTNATYSYYYWSTTQKKVISSTARKTEPDTLKTYATTLGYAFEDDTIDINKGYPVLRWELPHYQIVENQEYIKIGQNLPLTLERIMFREGMEDHPEDIEWSSSNEDVATVDSNGVVIGKGMGHTTITVYNSELGIKARAIINVYRNQEGAITIPQIVEQESSTIALKEDGTVWSSGLNDKGQLGDGTTTNRNIPVQVKINEDTYLTDVVKLTAGSTEGTVALTKDGEVYGWGNNTYGNLATNNTQRQLYAHKMEINSNEKIIDVSSGDALTHILTVTGRVYYVGTCIFEGNNCNNENETSYVLKEMTELEDTIKLESYSSWYGTYMAMQSNASTIGWGYDKWGQLGQGSTAMARDLTLIGTDIVNVEVGEYATIVQREDGDFYITGDNAHGGLGIGTSSSINIFQKMSLPNDESGNIRKIVKAQRQGWNTVVLASDGTVWASGNNEIGQLSQGNTINTSTFLQLKNNETEYLENAIDISSGETLGDVIRNTNIGVLKEDGTVWLSGDNTYGQIANGTNESANYLTIMGGEDTFNYQDNEIELYANEKYQIDAQKLYYENNGFNVFKKSDYEIGDNLRYTSLDENIATVNDNGEITAKEATGSTKIKIEDTTNGFETYITVNVKNRLQNTDTITYIYDANDLVAFRDDVNAGNDYAGKIVYVMADIDMSSVCSETVGSWVPIGATGTDFAGTFNGKYHTISNLYINNNSRVYEGLFYILPSNSIVRNIIMENIDILNTHDVIDGYNYVGGIAGSCYGTIQNCGINSGNIANIKKTAYTGSGIYPASYAGGITGRVDRKHKK